MKICIVEFKRNLWNSLWETTLYHYEWAENQNYAITHIATFNRICETAYAMHVANVHLWRGVHEALLPISVAKIRNFLTVLVKIFHIEFQQHLGMGYMKDSMHDIT